MLRGHLRALPLGLHPERDYATLSLHPSSGWTAVAKDKNNVPLSVLSRQGLSTYLTMGNNAIEFYAADPGTGKVLECTSTVEVVDNESPK